MPKCYYCERVFKDQQAMGSHIKTHLDDSDDDVPNQITHKSNKSSDDESVVSYLSYITDVDANEYNEDDALFTGIPNNPNNMYQEFPSEEYAEFMLMMTKFRVQNSLANAFIRFFNKYSNRNDNSLPSTLQAGREFMENLELPNFGWRKESIFKYKEKEYIFEYR